MAHRCSPGDRASRGVEKHPFPSLVALNDKSIYNSIFSDGTKLVLSRVSFSVCCWELILFLGRNCGRSYQHDAGVDASGLDAETACGEKAIGAGVGIDATHENGLQRHTALFELMHCRCPQIDVWATEETTSHDAWWKLGLQKSVDHFFAHFEGVGADARADYRAKIARVGAQGAHAFDGVDEDVAHHAAPTGVSGTNHTMLGVVEQHRHAIGGGDADAYVRQCGD